MPSHVDQGRPFDYGRTSSEYGAFRIGLPDAFFVQLEALGIGLHGQRIIDLGTGTGIVARALAARGATVAGIDISEGQVLEARRLAIEEGLSIRFCIAAAEAPPFASDEFDVAIANQAFLYFDKLKTVAALNDILIPGGRLVLSQFRRSSHEDQIAAATDALIRKYNPQWGNNDFGGGKEIFRQWIPDGIPNEFKLDHALHIDVHIPFTRETWRGRIRATRGVGASLSSDQIAAFDTEHRLLLENTAPAEFRITHRLEAIVLTLKR